MSQNVELPRVQQPSGNAQESFSWR